MEEQVAQDARKEIWRKVEGDYYAPLIFVTANGNIGINVGGLVFEKPVEDWHRLAVENSAWKGVSFGAK